MHFRAMARAISPTWLRESNARTVAFAMIETRAALDALDGILDTPGIDGIFLGPSDFSIAWSQRRDGQADARGHDGRRWKQVAARARKAGKHAGIYVIDPTMAGRFVVDGLPASRHAAPSNS